MRYSLKNNDKLPVIPYIHNLSAFKGLLKVQVYDVHLKLAINLFINLLYRGVELSEMGGGGGLTLYWFKIWRHLNNIFTPIISSTLKV